MTDIGAIEGNKLAMTDLRNQSLKLGQSLIDLVRGRWRPGRSVVNDLYQQSSTYSKLISPTQLTLASILGGISGIGIIATINLAAKSSENNKYLLLLPCLFVILLLIYRAAQTALISSCVTAVELVLEDTRVRTAKKITMLYFLSFESIQKQDVQAALTKHYETIYNLSIPIIQGANSVTLALFLILYLGYMSWQAAVLALITTFAISLLYTMGRNDLISSLSTINKSEANLLGAIDELFSGFKELKFNSKKHNLVFDNLSKSVSGSFKQRTLSNNKLIEMQVYFTVISYLFAGSVVFLLPLLSGHNYSDMGRIIALTLFLISPMGAITEAFQSIVKLKFSIESIYDFENMIDQLVFEANDAGPLAPFRSIKISNAEFSRHDSDGLNTFKVGPISLLLEPGKLIFVEGGNGSGKTTMMRMITGLYKPEKGSIYLNDQLVTEKNIQSYRELFGIIFADFFVFDKPYGLTPDQLNSLRENINKLGLSHCMTEDIEIGLNPEKLSTGQKKRLALALILAEDPPILIFDEWAADQDPNFRRIFYHEILPKLKAEGKSILAITHDDHYFSIADQRYHMEYGQMKLVKNKGTLS